MRVVLKGRVAQQCLPVSGPGAGSWNIHRQVSLPGAGSQEGRRSRRATLIFQTAISCLTNSPTWLGKKRLVLPSKHQPHFPLHITLPLLSTLSLHFFLYSRLTHPFLPVCCLTLLLPLTSLFSQMWFLSLRDCCWAAVCRCQETGWHLDQCEWGSGG